MNWLQGILLIFIIVMLAVLLGKLITILTDPCCEKHRLGYRGHDKKCRKRK